MLPKFKSVRLETKAGEILLREVQRKDLKELNRIINDPDVNRFVLHNSPGPMKSTVNEYNECRKSKKPQMACIFRDLVVESFFANIRPGRFSHISGFGIAFTRCMHWGGVPEKTVRFCFAWLKKNGIKKIIGETFSDNLRARRFYRKLGFWERCVLKMNVKRGNRYVDSIIIEKFM